MDNQQEIADDLVETFEMFDSWEDRYGVLIDFGKKLPPLDESDKIEENRVHGCQSQVWMIARPREEDGQTVIDFIAESDALIVKGLIAILRKIYSGQTPQNILIIRHKRFFAASRFRSTFIIRPPQRFGWHGARLKFLPHNRFIGTRISARVLFE